VDCDGGGSAGSVTWNSLSAIWVSWMWLAQATSSLAGVSVLPSSVAAGSQQTLVAGSQ
jgi:hypothetical protein